MNNDNIIIIIIISIVVLYYYYHYYYCYYYYYYFKILHNSLHILEAAKHIKYIYRLNNNYIVTNNIAIIIYNLSETCNFKT